MGKTNSAQEFSLNNIRLKNVNHHPYLGVELSCDLKWDRNIENITSWVSRLLGMFARVLKSVDTRTRKAVYKIPVRPLLEYGCQVWNRYLRRDITKLKEIQNRLLCFVFKVPGQISFTKLRYNTIIPYLSEKRKELREKLLRQIKCCDRRSRNSS